MKDFLGIPINVFPMEAMGFSRLNAQDISRSLFERASRLLVEDGSVDNVILLFTPKVCLIIDASNFFMNSKTKDMLSFLLRKVACDTDVQGIALVTEAWARKPTEEEKRTGIIDASRKVGDHPNRREAISVQCEWYDGGQSLMIASFERKKDGAGIEEITIQEPQCGRPEGRFANIFPPTRAGGYFN